MPTPEFVLKLREKIGHAEPLSKQSSGLFTGEVSGCTTSSREGSWPEER
ncbi:hypothetical protein [Bifidobacterium olomucense]|nr:hypothetical protein [Bifidobacterium sp. DSM 109959]